MKPAMVRLSKGCWSAISASKLLGRYEKATDFKSVAFSYLPEFIKRTAKYEGNSNGVSGLCGINGGITVSELRFLTAQRFLLCSLVLLLVAGMKQAFAVAIGEIDDKTKGAPNAVAEPGIAG